MNCNTQGGGHQMLSARICAHQKSSKRIQKHSRDTPEIRQRYAKVYQKKAVFLLKYCYDKDLKEWLVSFTDILQELRAFWRLFRWIAGEVCFEV